jgi:NAD(P)-dependent dehydrogenase (short-subunit alcohol dehydrogenase family)
MTPANPKPKFIALIAGGGSGIGRGCALRLAREGWHLVLVGRNPNKLDAVAEEVRTAGGTATTFPADVRDWDAMAALGSEMEADGLDLFINSAGGQFAAPQRRSDARWLAVGRRPQPDRQLLPLAPLAFCDGEAARRDRLYRCQHVEAARAQSRPFGGGAGGRCQSHGDAGAGMGT